MLAVFIAVSSLDTAPMAPQVIKASKRTPGRNRGRGFHPLNDSRVGAGAIGNAGISGCVKYAFTRAIVVLTGFGTVWMSSPPSAMADPSGGDAKQESTGSQTTPDESESTNMAATSRGLKTRWRCVFLTKSPQTIPVKRIAPACSYG
jgi:hypothetical protein